MEMICVTSQGDQLSSREMDTLEGEREEWWEKEEREERRREEEREGEEEEEGKEKNYHETFVYQCYKAMVTFGNCFPFPVRTKRGRENGWLSERLDVDLLLSVSSLLTGSPALGSKVNNNILISFR